MARNNNTIIWIVISAFAVMVILSLLLSKKAVNWSTMYEENDKHPYGSSFIQTLLKERVGEQNFREINEPFNEVYAGLDSSGMLDTAGSFLYVFIGYTRHYDSLETGALLDFVAAGNTVFAAAEYVNTELVDTLLTKTCKKWRRTYSYYSDEDDDYNYYEDDDDTWSEAADTFTAKFSDSLEAILSEVLGEDSSAYEESSTDTEEYFWEIKENVLEDDYEYDYDDEEEDSTGYWYSIYSDQYYGSSIIANFEDAAYCSDSGYTFYHYYRSDTQSTYWTYFYSNCLADVENGTDVLGNARPGMPNFVRIPHGEGYMYLHTNPELFTNVELLKKNGFKYSENVFAYLEADNVLWDEYRAPTDSNWDIGSDTSPLSYILSEPPLRWSMYLIFAGTLLYIFFRAKRRQQYIPVIEPNVNTSLEYVEMLGQLYFEQKDHRYMAGQMWNQFIDFNRTYYYVNPSEQTENWVKKLSMKSTVSENRIMGIERAYKQANRANCLEEDLTNLYLKLKYFYSNCK